MTEIIEQLEQPQILEESGETYSGLEARHRTKVAQGDRTHPQWNTDSSLVVDELLVRRIITALTTEE